MFRPIGQLGVVVALLLASAPVRAQGPTEPDPAVTFESSVPSVTDPTVEPAKAEPAKPEQKYAKEDHKRIGGILPNFRTTSIDAANLKPLTVKEKFKLATADAFDRSAFFTMGLLAGISHASHQYPSIPLGAKGLAHRYGLVLADSITTAYFIEAVVPSVIHQDPRYFRKGTGSGWGRVGYALSRNFVIPTDKRKLTVNTPELLGVGASSALGNLYYPAAERGGRNTAIRFGIGIATDSLANMLREFWPDISKRLSRR
ncbi:MAG: hypothetical protein U0Q16_14720 [Bryobacteraceae bacterium]